jgi:DNA polymerase
MDLNELQMVAARCELCKLHKGRINPAFAKGDDQAPVVICGMCPGPEENAQGLPFVGTAGQVLDEVILSSFGPCIQEPLLSYNGIYITNLVKCFLNPGVSPEEESMNACLPYLLVQLSVIKPQIIIGLGAAVCQYLLRTERKIGELRGKVFEYMGAKFICTYHPSYLARGGGSKHRDFRKVVGDFQLALEHMKGV